MESFEYCAREQHASAQNVVLLRSGPGEWASSVSGPGERERNSEGVKLRLMSIPGVTGGGPYNDD